LSQTQNIPAGSEAKAASIYPPGSLPPGPGADCLAFGYWSPTTPYVLNYIPAVISNATTCSTSYPGNFNAQTQFCAYLRDANGKNAFCGVRAINDSNVCMLSLSSRNIKCQLVFTVSGRFPRDNVSILEYPERTPTWRDWAWCQPWPRESETDVSF